MSPVGFKPATPASKWPQIDALEKEEEEEEKE
jgi:hypothetical protein